MGFGLLLIGYMFAFVVTSALPSIYLFGVMLFGSIFMFFGLKELKKYDPVFLYAFIGDILLFVCAIFGIIIWALGTFTQTDTEIIETILRFTKLAVNLYFEISMLYGIADLSRRVDYPDTRQKAIRNMIFVGVFNVYQLITLLIVLISSDEKVIGTLLTVLMLAQIIYTAINSLLLLKCYAMICPAGEEDMPRKKSRFAFINKLHDIKDAKDEKAINEMKNYYENKLKKKNAKRKHKKK